MKLGPHTYKITRSKTLRRDRSEVGRADYVDQTIKLDDSMPDTELGVCFIHELVHVIAHVYHAGDQYSEDVTDSMANGLVAYFQDNLGITFDFRDIPNGD